MVTYCDCTARKTFSDLPLPLSSLLANTHTRTCSHLSYSIHPSHYWCVINVIVEIWEEYLSLSQSILIPPLGVRSSLHIPELTWPLSNLLKKTGSASLILSTHTNVQFSMSPMLSWSTLPCEAVKTIVAVFHMSGFKERSRSQKERILSCLNHSQTKSTPNFETFSCVSSLFYTRGVKTFSKTTV